MKLFRDLRLSLKLLSAPALALLFLAGSGILSYQALSTDKAILSDIFENRFKTYQESSTLFNDIANVHSSLYKVIGWVNSRYEEKKIDALSKEQLEALKSAATRIESILASSNLTEAERALFVELQSSLKEYEKNAAGLLDIVQVDANAGIMYIGMAEEKYQLLSKSMKKLLALENELSQASYSQAIRNFKATSTKLAAIVVIAILLSVLTSVIMSRLILGPVLQVVEAFKNMSSGDLTSRIEVRSKDEIGVMGRCFNEFVSKLEGIIREVINSSSLVAEAASQFHSTSESMASGGQQVAAQAGSVASACEQMAANSNMISENCRLAAESSKQATQSATTGGRVLQETLNGMQKIASQVKNAAKEIEGLGARSDQIGKIVTTIHEITRHTNLLALNAAIEAERAGEHGRGFAVVAEEVRALSLRTTEATREISNMIKLIQEDTKNIVATMAEGVKTVEKGTADATNSSMALQDILQEINQLGAQVVQIANAAMEQTKVTGNIAENIQEISTIVRESAKGSHESAAASTRLADSAGSLQSMVSQFRISDGKKMAESAPETAAALAMSAH